MTEAEHDAITAQIGGKANYGKGVFPNPFFLKMQTHCRRASHRPILDRITHKIEMLSEPRFHTGTETSELMESLIAMVGAKQILELGMHTGRSTLHFLRAIIGVEGAQVVSVDARPTHDREFFEHLSIAPHFQFIQGWTPQCLENLSGRMFDFVFVDSAHDLEHTQQEVAALQSITHAGTMFCFHDVPAWRNPEERTPPPVRVWLQELIASGEYSGLILPSPRQLDCQHDFGKEYNTKLSPGLAVLARQ